MPVQLLSPGRTVARHDQPFPRQFLKNLSHQGAGDAVSLGDIGGAERSPVVMDGQVPQSDQSVVRFLRKFEHGDVRLNQSQFKYYAPESGLSSPLMDVPGS